VALVTGASRGIGRAIALAFSAAGADVAVLARSNGALEQLVDEIRASGRTALALPCDVTQPEEIRETVDRVLGELGRIDVLVNNAGGPVFNAPFLDTRPEGWRRVVELNLFSVVGFCHAVGAQMVERRTGSVINIGTMGAAHPAPMVAAYCAAKAAVINLTVVLAQEWGAAGVRVNAISPGWIDTPLNAALIERPAVAEAIARRIPLQRWGEPADLTEAAVWLASDASSYVTGAEIPIDGGVGIVAPQAAAGPPEESRGWAG
jgi:2-deoxy-D-gluconate 3-dehydrogenase